MGYYIYGKRTEPIKNTKTNQWMGPDKRFAALDRNGLRVARLADAAIYDTKEDAQKRIDKSKGKPGVVFEIRKAK